jgi:hypothetical protein
MKQEQFQGRSKRLFDNAANCRKFLELLLLESTKRVWRALQNS